MAKKSKKQKAQEVEETPTELRKEEQPVFEPAQVPEKETRVTTRKPFILYETLENHLNNLLLSIQGGRIIALDTGRRVHVTHIEVRCRLHDSDDLIDVVVSPTRVLDDENVSVLDGCELMLTDLEGNVVQDTTMVEAQWHFESVQAGEYRLKLYHSVDQFMFLGALRAAVLQMKEESPNAFTISRKELSTLRDEIYDLLVEELDAQVTEE